MAGRSIAERCSITSAIPQLRHMLVLTGAGMLQNAVDFLRPLVFNFFVSRNLTKSALTQEERAFTMDCVSLASMTINILCFASAMGFNTGIDAYAPIAFGAKDTVELHLVLYRQGVLLCLLLPIFLLMLHNIAGLLVLVGQPADKAQGVASVLHLLAWSVPGDLIYDVLARWLKSQQKHRMVTACVLAGFAANLVINALGSSTGTAREDPTEWPILAMVIQNTSLPLLLLGSLHLQGHKFVMKPVPFLFRGLWVQLRTSLQAMIWSCTEMWAWEVQVFEAAALGPGAAATYSILSLTYSLLICMGMGVYPALTALLGEALGARDFCRGLALLKLGCVVGFVSLSAYAVLLLLVRQSYALTFSGGVAKVADNIYHLVPVILVVQLADCLLNTLRSWLVVRKLQAFGVIQSIACYWLLAVPLGYFLCFQCSAGILGLYAGLGAAVFFILLTSTYRIYADFQGIVGKGCADTQAALLQGFVNP
ncbi:unnamed protein product [Prorocentrum cordatum]|uniref:Protein DETOXIFICATION n=1 Tax=Prorocentrum cordatum TaxID=2364126 RepID=A0ABN9XYS4_9DINO|nr:unnamed protein product [Polarella glacialis]